MADQPQAWTVETGAGGVLLVVAPEGPLARGASSLDAKGGALAGAAAGILRGGGAELDASFAGGSQLLGAYGQGPRAGLGQSFASRDTAVVYSGDAALRYTFAAGGQAADWQGILTNDPTKGSFCLPLRPGASYRLTLATRVATLTGGPAVRVVLAYGGALSSLSSYSFGAPNVWETRELAVVVPAGALPNAALLVQFQRGTTAATDFWVDSVRIEENAIVATDAGQATAPSIKDQEVPREKLGPTTVGDLGSLGRLDLVVNGDFEARLAYWGSATPGAISIEAASPDKGSYSLKVSHTGASVEDLYQDDSPLDDPAGAKLLVRVQPGSAVYLAARAKLSAASGLALAAIVEEYGHDGGFLDGTASFTWLTETTFTSKEARKVLGASTYYIVLRFLVSGASSGSAWLDEVHAWQNPAVPWLAAKRTAANPGYAFHGDINTGFDSPADDELDLITGGVVRAHIDAAGLIKFGFDHTSEFQGLLAQFMLDSTGAGSNRAVTIDHKQSQASAGTIYGLVSEVRTTHSSGTVVQLLGSSSYAKADSGSPVTNIRGAEGLGWVGNNAAAVALLQGGLMRVLHQGSGVVAKATVLNIAATKSGSGSITDIAGLQIDDLSAVATGQRWGVDAVNSFRTDWTAVAGETRALVYDVNNAALARVSKGAANSGGAGFALLRIPN